MSSYPSRRYYERVARESGYPPGPLERVFRLAEFMARIGSVAPGELLLRGGTALNLVHLDAPRLSVDLDLDYVGSDEAGAAQLRRPELLRELEELAIRAGYKVERARPSYAMAHLVLRYEDVSGRSAALKLDLNFLDRVPVLDPVRLPLRHPFSSDLEVSPVLTFALDELAASKVIALARRGLARDLFDVAALAQTPQLDLDLARTVLVVRGAAYPPPSPEAYAPDAGERVRLVDWRSQVVALALRGRPVDLADAQLRSASLLGELLVLRPAEEHFLRVLEEGALDPALLEAPLSRAGLPRIPGCSGACNAGQRASRSVRSSARVGMKSAARMKTLLFGPFRWSVTSPRPPAAQRTYP